MTSILRSTIISISLLIFITPSPLQASEPQNSIGIDLNPLCDDLSHEMGMSLAINLYQISQIKKELEKPQTSASYKTFAYAPELLKFSQLVAFVQQVILNTGTPTFSKVFSVSLRTVNRWKEDSEISVRDSHSKRDILLLFVNPVQIGLSLPREGKKIFINKYIDIRTEMERRRNRINQTLISPYLPNFTAKDSGRLLESLYADHEWTRVWLYYLDITDGQLKIPKSYEKLSSQEKSNRLFRIAQAAMHTGHYRPAIHLFNQVIEQSDGNLQLLALGLHSLAYARLGRFLESEPLISMALKRSPDFFPNLYIAMLEAAMMHDWPLAISRFESLIASVQKDARDPSSSFRLVFPKANEENALETLKVFVESDRDLDYFTTLNSYRDIMARFGFTSFPHRIVER